jgi:YD repeat-containing protein
LRLEYGYSGNGNVASQRIVIEGSLDVTQVYQYDALNRVTRVTEGTEFRGYGYSDVGNMWVSGTSGEMGMPAGAVYPNGADWFDPLTNRLKNVAAGVGYNEVTGELTSVGGRGFGYDAEGRMKWSTLNGVTTEYGYDGEGRRVRRGGVVYVYDAGGELAAEYGAAAGEGVRYVGADGLGSTRVVLDGAGMVAERYDYYPFGDMIAAGVNGRTVGMGYGEGETWGWGGGAVYREGTGWGDGPRLLWRAVLPQSWNLYSYGRNNPLRYVDPSGAYVCGATVTEDQCRNIEVARGRAVDAAEQLKQRFGENSKQYVDAQRAIDAYGSPGVDNGVTVTVGAVDQQMGGSVEVGGNLSAGTADNPNGQNILVTLATGQVARGGIGLAGALAHEGSHVADGSAWVTSGFSTGSNPTHYDTEVRGFNVGLQVIQVGGNVLPFRMGPPGGVLVPGFISSLNAGVIDRILAQRPYRITQQSPGGPAFDRRVRVRR